MSVDSEASIVRATSTSRTRDLRTGGGAEAEERGERRPVTTGAVGESGDPAGVWGDGGEVGTQIGGGGGNRHSHTLTEKEVGLGFQETQQHNGGVNIYLRVTVILYIHTLARLYVLLHGSFCIGLMEVHILYLSISHITTLIPISIASN